MKPWLVLVLVASLLAVPLSAQTVTGTMRGTVSDRSGGLLPGVTVTILNAETGLKRIVVTEGDGSYNAPFLQIGRYDVVAELSGFGSARRTGVPVELNQTIVQDFVLDPASVEEIVTVTADAPVIDVADGEIKQTLRATEIETLPLPDQANFLRMATLFSGFQENPTSGQDNPALSSGSSVNFNGTGTRGATFQVNGVNNDDASENQHRQNVPAATIQSFQVLTNNYSAEFGRGYGSIVLVQTKQGTNDLAGEIYGYFQDNKYITRDAAQVTLDHGKHYRRQFGATAGFPLLTDRLFAYVNYDIIQDRGQVLTTRGVFLASDLDPAKRLTLGNDTPENRAWQDAIIARFPSGPPNATHIASRGYQGFQNSDLPKRDMGARLDLNASANNLLTARYQRSHQENHPGELIRGEEAGQVNHQSSFGLTWTNVLTSDTVQEARVGIGLREVAWTITDDPQTPVVRMSGGTGLTFTILGNAGAFPIIRNQRDHQLVYNITTARWTKHTLKAGLDVRRSSLDDRAENFNRGFWNFAATCQGVDYGTAVAAFWAGCVNSYTQSFGPAYLQNRLKEENLYVQDDWRPWDNLVLNLGVRYERVGAPEEAEGLIDYGFDGSDYVDPRLGFAYTPDWDRNRYLRAVTGGNGNFSIRGGFGISHGRVFQSVFSQGGASIRYNPPNAITIAQASTNLADPLGDFVFVPGQITARAAATFADPDLQMPEARQWNLTFERQAFRTSRFRASYIGALGKNLLQYQWSNVPEAPAPPGTVGATWVVAQDWQCAGTGSAGVPVNAACPRAVPIAPNEVSLRVPRTNERRPDARFSDVRIVSNLAESWYHAGQLEWEAGDIRGFTGRATYTFGKALDTGAETTEQGAGDVGVFPPRPGTEQYARGYSRFDVRHRFTMLAAYAFPWMRERRDWLGQAFGGWTLSTVIRFASGTPYTIVDSAAPDILFLGTNMKPNRPVCVDPAHCGGSIASPDDNGTVPASAFRRATYGDTLESFVGRNTYRADGAESVDGSLSKSFPLPMGTSLVVRLDCFNIFNQTRWWIPGNDFNAPATFGRVTQTAYGATNSGGTAPNALSPPRTFQLGLRIIY
ncbi:MAG TPA: carboxypeptidase regulatory-like domain-containing protein [Thermoanaerobaculia bacterium]|nr:carboxypeptidase regulatory-like domain-containing protein [Thermoanaerobaculia bacterium]